MEYMEKERKFRKQALENDKEISISISGIWNEYEHLNSKKNKDMKHNRNRFKFGKDDGSYSEEENSARSCSREKQEIGTKDFNKIKTLGQGRYGEVSLVVKKTTGSRYAMKKVII
jgi:hypothetical protein